MGTSKGDWNYPYFPVGSMSFERIPEQKNGIFCSCLCLGSITPLVIQPSILKDVLLSSLPVLHVVKIFRLKSHGENILSQRLMPFNYCDMDVKDFKMKHVLTDGYLVARLPQIILRVTASLRPISALCALPVLPATSFSTFVMSVFSTWQPKTTSPRHSP